LKKHNNSAKKSEPTSKRTKSPGPVRQDTKEVLAELVAKLIPDTQGIIVFNNVMSFQERRPARGCQFSVGLMQHRTAPVFRPPLLTRAAIRQPPTF
jgi:hypothetical protein